MVDIEARLKELGITLPPASAPSHSYVSARQVGNVLYVSGHVPKRDGGYPYVGKLGAEVTLEQGQESARICIINCLTSAKAYLGDLNRIKGVIKLVGFVASAPSFTDQPQVINAGSNLLIEIFGESGRHARSSIGMAVLPSDVPVEIELILEIEG
jgi:enamine deaminase RidA (YjgF/YER057c/UK114 family)